MPFPLPRCNSNKERESCPQPVSPNAGSIPSNRASRLMTFAIPVSRDSVFASCRRAASATSSTANPAESASGTPSVTPVRSPWTVPAPGQRPCSQRGKAGMQITPTPAIPFPSRPWRTRSSSATGGAGNHAPWRVESGAGAPALGSGGTTPFVGDAVAPKGIPSLSFRSSVRLPWPRFQAPAHQTGRADFPHPAFGRDHVFAHGRSRVFNPRRVRPWSCHSLRFEKRTYLPTLTLCFRQNHRRSRFVACRSIAE